ncbi:hypothetical protein EAO75_33275 [Streptomyces sp. uw30]|nr:hypothetical protein EAO75_33275 [Streptomyces sp. uw30]
MASAGLWGLVAPPSSRLCSSRGDPHRGGAANRCSPAPLGAFGLPPIDPPGPCGPRPPRSAAGRRRRRRSGAGPPSGRRP